MKKTQSKLESNGFHLEVIGLKAFLEQVLASNRAIEKSKQEKSNALKDFQITKYKLTYPLATVVSTSTQTTPYEKNKSYGVGVTLAGGTDYGVSYNYSLPFYNVMSGIDPENPDAGTQMISSGSSTFGVNFNLLKDSYFFVGGNQGKQAQLQVAQVLNQIDASRLEVLYQAQEAYFQLLMAGVSLHDGFQKKEMSEKTFQQTVMLKKIGKSTNFDLIESEIQVQIAEQDLTSAKIAFQDACIRLSNLLAKNESVFYFPAMDWVDSSAVDGKLDFESVQKIALKNRSDIKEALSKSKLSSLELASTFNAKLPALSFGVSVSNTTTENSVTQDLKNDLVMNHPKTALTLGFSYPLNDVASDEAYRKKVTDAAQSELDLADLTKNMNINLAGLLKKLDQKKSGFEIAKKRLDLAQKRSEISNIEYKEGLIDTKKHLDIQTDYWSARVSWLSALIELLQMNGSLRKEMGLAPLALDKT